MRLEMGRDKKSNQLGSLNFQKPPSFCMKANRLSALTESWADLVEHYPMRFYDAVYFLADDHSFFHCVQLGIGLRTVAAVYLVTNFVDDRRLALADQILQMLPKSC